MRLRSQAALFTVVASVLVGCGHQQPAPPAPATPETAASEYAATIRDRVTADAMMAHLTKLQQIADANHGTRAMGTPGYQASVDYVADALRDKGFDVQTPEFEVRLPFAEEPVLTVSGARVPAKPLNYTIGTPEGGVRGPLVAARADDSPGCAESDYDGLPVRGAVVLVDRGTCPFGDKQANAAKRGAVALIVANNVDGDEFGGTLGEDTDVQIPVVSVTKAEGARLRAAPGPVSLTMKAGVNIDRTRNVIAQTKTGSTADVVMVGAHLDSVPEGPGINDNGSGVAAVLETALQMGSSPDVRNAVRFGFWGAEELGVVGSDNYISTLGVDQLKDIALYLNFDMLGSPNPAYFTYDGDQSLPPDKDGNVPRVPEGSAGIERTLVAYLDAAGKPARDTSFDGRSDYDGFTKAGIPSGGFFSGADENMTEEQARLWGGKANQPFDPNYHKATDTLDHVDRTSLDIQGKGVGYVVGLYAQDQRGRNGVPVRDDRTRHPLSGS
ncbi:lipoprotein aminopeptidase lpqL [Mycolicibacterium canariasense]|uniref:Lipoprotein aminopeptidase lpqL n=1 Tax=Mycolicibacterium canariasense TaxID=228230 RepID=A0A100WGE6_MYCCR|nr:MULTISPECIES: M28 family metallopeptidase [Mycolicibacterium]MCV7209769.1 M28 family peptidase [Mycolicibacterium canariasense]MCX2710674.1 M28 family metallopeptidase [Mycolicibacterium sp. J2]ORU99667.1 amidohydrolase [Mycolicibacterium canariasense]GAS97782.1 lipoprotein aminopeptidase lpqL [Mycolicibacterium canariasense]